MFLVRLQYDAYKTKVIRQYRSKEHNCSSNNTMVFTAFLAPATTSTFTKKSSTVSSLCSRRTPLSTSVSNAPARWSAVTYQPVNKNLMSPVPIPYSVPNENKKPGSAAPKINFNPDTLFDPVLHKNQFSGHTNFHLDVIGNSPQSTIEFNGKTYYLKQLHLHAPAEHTLGNRDRENDFPLEVHFVHNSSATDTSGQFCVLGVLIVNGGKNDEFQKIIDGIVEEIQADEPEEHDPFDCHSHDHEGETNKLEQMLTFNLRSFIGGNVLDPNLLVTYVGSLTTKTTDSNGNPSFLPGQVQWIVSRDVTKASPDQISKLTSFMGAIGDARDLQPTDEQVFFSYVL